MIPLFEQLANIDKEAWRFLRCTECFPSWPLIIRQVASFAAWSAISLPSIPISPGIHTYLNFDPVAFQSVCMSYDSFQKLYVRPRLSAEFSTDIETDTGQRIVLIY